VGAAATKKQRVHPAVLFVPLLTLAWLTRWFLLIVRRLWPEACLLAVAVGLHHYFLQLLSDPYKPLFFVLSLFSAQKDRDYPRVKLF
jgi:hypothetical protein